MKYFSFDILSFESDPDYDREYNDRKEDEYFSFLELVKRSGREKDKVRMMTRYLNARFHMEGNNLIYKSFARKQIVTNVRTVLAVISMFLKISDFSEEEIRVLKLDRLINLLTSDFSVPVSHNFLAS